MLDAPEWMAVTSKASKIDPYVALIDLCIQIPRVLERTDKIDPADIPAANTLIEDSLSLAAKAKAWFAGFEKHGPRYTSMDVDDFEGFKVILHKAGAEFIPTWLTSRKCEGLIEYILWDDEFFNLMKV